MMAKIIVIGGVAGGATAAARIRRLDEDAEIIVFEKGDYISYANCGLPYYIGGVIEDEDELLLQTPESMKARYNIDVRVNCEVMGISPADKTIEVSYKQNGTSSSYKVSYDKLILSPGAEPAVLKLPGIDSPRLFTLRNVADTFKIKKHINQKDVRKVVIVGAGFIGIEMAENLCNLGLNTTVVELADNVLGVLDADMASIIQKHLLENGIELYLKNSVISFSDTEDGIIAELSSGTSIKADMVIFSIGVKPDIRLAVSAGLKLGQSGGIKVDEFMQTSEQDIFAAGDAVEVFDFTNGKPALIPLAGPANKQGRIAADNIFGRCEEYVGTQGTSIVKVFDMAAAITGNNERLLKRNGIDYMKSYTHSMPHAGYYPGGSQMSVKLLFRKDNGKLLGAQIVGYEGVDKRIDVIATAIRFGATVYDLEKLELAYAPPFSSAKDPVNMAGYVASNILKGDCRVYYWNDVEHIDLNKSILIDVRTPEEYELGTIVNAINIPVDCLRDRLDEIPRDKEVCIFCQIGLRGYLAVRILMSRGYKDVRNLSGGYKTYSINIES